MSVVIKSSSAPALTPSPEELLGRARAVVPRLAERAEAAERAGKVPEETIAELQAAGFFRVLQPRRAGGYEMTPRTFFELQMILGEGCMSTSWVYGVLGVHPWQLGLFDARAQDEVWGEDSSTIVASTYIPVGQVTSVPGGFRLSGRWSFSSGCDHARWIFLGGMVPPRSDESEPHYRTFLVPQADFRIIRNWDVLGLKATGSHDILVNDAFVPEYRTHKTRDDSPAARPGLAVNDGPLYRLPFGQVFYRAVSTSCIGGLQGALNAFRQVASKQVSRNFLGRTALDPIAQTAAAESTVAIDQMKALLLRQCETVMAAAERGEETPLQERLLYRFECAQVADICAEHVSRLLRCCGGSGIYRRNPLTRYFLDIHAGRAHVANNQGPVARNFGGFLLGEPNLDPTC